MLSTAFLFAASMVVGQAEDPAVPQRAKDALNFLVGSWTVDGRVGEQKYKGEQQTRWAQGKHCVIANWTGSLGNREVHGTAIIGWDAGEGQVVDAGFIDTVGHRTIRWTIENDNAWIPARKGGRNDSKVREEGP